MGHTDCTLESRRVFFVMAEPIEIKFNIDPESYSKMEELNKRLGTPNVATAIFSAVQILNRLLDYEKQGFQLAVVDKSGRTQPLPFPPKVAQAA